MKLNNKFKVIWWVIILALITFFIVKRYSMVSSGSVTSIDIVIFLVWILLLLVPLFEEVSIYGLRFRKEIESLKKEMNEQILNLKNDIQNRIDIRNQFNQRISIDRSPPENELPHIQKRYNNILKKTLKDHDFKPRSVASWDSSVPPDVKFLFSVRYEIDSELRRISRNRYGDRSPLTTKEIITSLANSQVIYPVIAGMIQELYTVCSPALHGVDVSENQANFIKEIAPKLIAYLKDTK